MVHFYKYINLKVTRHTLMQSEELTQVNNRFEIIYKLECGHVVLPTT
jgi:hypothetical protein